MHRILNEPTSQIADMTCQGVCGCSMVSRELLLHVEGGVQLQRCIIFKIGVPIGGLV